MTVPVSLQLYWSEAWQGLRYLVWYDDDSEGERYCCFETAVFTNSWSFKHQAGARGPFSFSFAWLP